MYLSQHVLIAQLLTSPQQFTVCAGDREPAACGGGGVGCSVLPGRDTDESSCVCQEIL